MSDERLRQRLVQAGYREADVVRFERADLLAYYAKVLLAETAYVPPPQRGDDVDVEEAAAGEGDAEKRDPNPGFLGDEGGDFQMRFLALEEKKLEEQRMQREEQRQQRELEMLRLEEQRRQGELEQKGLEFEQMKWKEELDLKIMEKASRESPAAKIKSGVML